MNIFLSETFEEHTRIIEKHCAIDIVRNKSFNVSELKNNMKDKLITAILLNCCFVLQELFLEVVLENDKKEK